jgi:hypothetical protein
LNRYLGQPQNFFDYFGCGSPGETEAEFADDEPLIPYYLDGFLYGSGGGRSGRLAKPSYQAALSGKFRIVPDISWLADPFTGGIIALSVPNASPELQYFVHGGTSLACPMFSALWAIARQAAGERLGQAAPLLYAAPPGAIEDIVPVGSSSNVTAVLKTGAATIDVPADALARPLELTLTYFGA